MKKNIIVLVIAFISTLSGFSQIKFEKGYFIDNSDKKTEVLIKNVDWKSNPTAFEYKISETTPVKNITIKDVKEFGIYNFSKYKRFTVDIDRSSEHNDKISFERNPVFKEETLFLKELVQGDANLYLYSFADLRRYFYSVNGSKLKQLVYKTYYLPEGSKDQYGNKIVYGVNTGVNESYKQQLMNDLVCKSLTINDAKNAKYKRNSLVNYFVKYNQCKNPSEVKNWDNNKSTHLFKLYVRPGINLSKHRIKDLRAAGIDYNVNLNTQLSFRLGVEAEYVFPFNRNKWAVFAEPSYQYYSAEKEKVINPGDAFFEVRKKYTTDYKSIDIPIGIRHYMFLNDESKIFINLAYVINFDLNKSILSDNVELAVSGREAYNFTFGIGYSRNKFSVELRQSAARDLLNSYITLVSKYTTTSLIVGYTIFDK